jgi:tRNA U34 5-carboxymethylaminomethyl modifying GTPase MnmE/TrmE
MKECLILGKPNSGKTLLLLNFAEYLGYRQLELTIHEADQTQHRRTYGIAEARLTLVSPAPHHTRVLQAVHLRFAKGKSRCDLALTDTTGLSEGIHEQLAVRRSMSRTLHRLRQAELVLHVIDGSRVAVPGAPEAMGELDHQLARFATGRVGYAMIVNKMDLPGAAAGLSYVRSCFPHHLVIPVSALRKRGFREVKTFVAGFF